jgi:hypothetical protein
VKPVEHNPYAPPKTSFEFDGGSGCSRTGNLLVVPAGELLPPRCVKCNEPATMDKARTFVWHHPGWYIFVPINILLYILIGAFVQKKAKLAFGLCGEHRRRRRNFTLASWGIFAVGVAVLFAAVAESSVLLGSAGGFLWLVAAIVGTLGSRVLTASRIDKQEARLKGCGEAFLDSLPHR